MSEEDVSSSNANTLRDCFSAELLRRITTTSTKTPKRSSGRSRKRLSSDTKPAPTTTQTNSEQKDAEELADFIDFLSQELFDALPPELQTLTYNTLQANPSLEDTLSSSSYAEGLLETLPGSITESLTAYSLLPSSTSPQNLLLSTLTAYISSTTAAPPLWITTRTPYCEICTRDWIPLTYHHLIPKSTHDKVRKRGWHPDHVLNSVAWLCRACHSYVHSLESNEVLAREYFTVERLLERDDVRRWAGWVGRVRWKAR